MPSSRSCPATRPSVAGVRFRIEQPVAAPPAAVQDALLDRDFLARLAELPKLGSPELLDQRREGDLVIQRVRYQFVGDLNSAARRIVDPARLSWVEESTTDTSSYVTTFRIVPDNYANLLKSGGTFRLQPRGDAGTLRVAEGDVDVRVPLVGRKVEQAIVSGLQEHAGAEAEVLERWIASHGAR